MMKEGIGTNRLLYFLFLADDNELHYLCVKQQQMFSRYTTMFYLLFIAISTNNVRSL